MTETDQEYTMDYLVQRVREDVSPNLKEAIVRMAYAMGERDGIAKTREAIAPLMNVRST